MRPRRRSCFTSSLRGAPPSASMTAIKRCLASANAAGCGAVKVRLRVTVGGNPSGTLATIIPIAKARLVEKGKEINIKGWVRTHRSSKNVSFIATNDGSTIKNIQIVAETTLFSEDLLKQITTGRTTCYQNPLILAKDFLFSLIYYPQTQIMKIWCKSRCRLEIALFRP